MAQGTYQVNELNGCGVVLVERFDNYWDAVNYAMDRRSRNNMVQLWQCEPKQYIDIEAIQWVHAC